MYTCYILRCCCSFLFVIILFINLSKAIPWRIFTIMRILITTSTSIFKRANTSMVSLFIFKELNILRQILAIWTAFKQIQPKFLDKMIPFWTSGFETILHWWHLWFFWLHNIQLLILLWFDTDNRAKAEDILSLSFFSSCTTTFP